MRFSPSSAITSLLAAVLLAPFTASCDGSNSLVNHNGALTCEAPAVPGCAASPSFQICGPSSCDDPCSASDMVMTCTGASPDDALGCTVIPIPTPSNVLYFCCPCAK
jgi:hypothetical protein